MNYTKGINDYPKALGLSEQQVSKIHDALNAAYGTNPDNVDEVNAIVAPVIETPEEAFYAATTVFTDLYGAYLPMLHHMMENGLEPPSFIQKQDPNDRTSIN